MTHNSVQYIYLQIEHRGQNYRCEIEIRLDDMARYLAEKAASNSTKRTRLMFGKATARPVKS